MAALWDRWAAGLCIVQPPSAQRPRLSSMSTDPSLLSEVKGQPSSDAAAAHPHHFFSVPQMFLYTQNTWTQYVIMGNLGYNERVWVVMGNLQTLGLKKCLISGKNPYFLSPLHLLWPKPPPAGLDSMFLHIEEVIDVSSRLLSLLDQKQLQSGEPDFLQSLCKRPDTRHLLWRVTLTASVFLSL